MVQKVFQMMSLRLRCSKKHITYFPMIFISKLKQVTFICMLVVNCNKLFHFSSQTIFMIQKYKPVLNQNCSTKKLLSKLQLK